MEVRWDHLGVQPWLNDQYVRHAGTKGETFVMRVYAKFTEDVMSEIHYTHEEVRFWLLDHCQGHYLMAVAKPCYPGDLTVMITDPDEAALFKLTFVT